MIIVWAMVLGINVIRCINYKEPISFLAIGGLNDNFGGTHEFIGYSIKYYPSYKDFEKKMFHTELTLFNTKLFETAPIQTNRKIENAKIEVLKDSITKDSVTIIITDTNEFSYNWLGTYEIENYDNWRRTKIEKEFGIDDIVPRDNNNQITIKLDWSKQYEQLSSGTYRIVKEVFDKSHGYIDIHSNELEIVK